MSKRSILYVGLAVLGVAALIGVILVGYSVDWTGFQAYTDPKGDFHPSKSLWDWMSLLIVPVVLGVGVFLLNRSEQRRQTDIATRRAKAESKWAQERAETDYHIAEDRLQEEALQSYLDKMTQLLLEKDLRKSSAEDEVRAVARARTLTVLRRLNGERRGLVVRFLYESELIQRESASLDSSGVIVLSEADLRGANLNGAKLFDANLSGADLSGARLNEADLSGADLSRADLNRARLILANLSGADLKGAYLKGANLNQANLSQANLKGANLIVASVSQANLSRANLSGACVSEADLSEADLSRADLNEARYNDTTIWPDGFDPIAAGAKKVNLEPQDEISADKSTHA